MDVLVILIYFCSFDFCTAEQEDSPVENLGQVVFGERIRASPYNVGIPSVLSHAIILMVLFLQINASRSCRWYTIIVIIDLYLY